LDTDIRALVLALIESKPEVAINTAFITDFRKELLFRAHGSARARRVSTPSPFTWWLFRLAPLGAFAVIMLMMLPHEDGTPQSIPPYFESYNQIDTGTYDSTLKTVPSNAELERVSIQNPVILQSVVLPKSGFVVLKTERGEVLGVSKLLPPGTTVGVYVNLIRIPDSSEPYVTSYYIDDGDGIYTEKDTLY